MKILVLLLVLITGACGSNNTKASAPGFGGELTLEVSVKDKQIQDIKVVSHTETESVGGVALPILREEILNAQTPEVDNVSGATYTSFAYRSAVAKALKEAGVGEYKITLETTNNNQLVAGEDLTTDVLIIGGGGAGLTAAISAREQGVEVLVIEKMGILGGNSLYAEGGLNAAGTRLQAKEGVPDNAEIFFNDTMKGGKNLNDPALVKILADESSNTVDWLEERGVPLTKLSLSGGSEFKRVHQEKSGNAVGPHIVSGLAAKAKQLGVPMLVNTRAVDLIIENNQIKGVKVTDKNTRYTIYAKSVIIATGGFGNNNPLVASYRSDLKGFKSSNQKGATGDLFDVANKLGIKLKDMKEIQIHPTGEASRFLLITESVRGNGALLVNSQGKRFINELGTRDVVSAAVLAQEGGKGYLIYDEQVRAGLGAIKKYESLGLVKKGKDLNEIATIINADPATLAATVEEFNSYVEANEDPAFGRKIFGTTITKPSFYAIAVTPVVHHTMGGIAINTNTEVSFNNGSVIKGLYAAGEVTGGVHGANRLGGNAVSDFATFGRISGNAAADFVKNN